MNIIWKPQPRQKLFMSRFENEALYGGAAGGGKSDCAIAEALRQVNIPHYRGLILRKTYPQLSEIVDRSREIYLPSFPDAKYNDQKHCWTFPSGAKIYFGAMQHTKDRTNYQGKRYDFIDFDELTHFTWDEYSYLFSRNRPNGSGTRCYIRAQANPGGIGHGWVKERFISPAPPMTTMWDNVRIIFPDGKSEVRRRSRIFIPSSVFDNKILMQNDPEYITRLASLPENERKALLYGDWDTFSGQVFTGWRNNPDGYITRKNTHVIKPFAVPDSNGKSPGRWPHAGPCKNEVPVDGQAYRIILSYNVTSRTIVSQRNGVYVKFRWEDESPNTFFEMRISYNELTRENTLEITDFADKGEVDDQKELWNSQIENLRRLSGM